ncbi:MAG: hypothetical protein WBL87_01125, partial [Methanothrix sp.]
TKAVPNQGIRLSVRNSVFLGIIIGAISGCLFGVIAYIQDSGNYLADGLIIGSSSAILIGLFYGGMDVIQHYVLRMILWMDKKITWNYDDFLDYCVDRIFIQRVGGGYIFIHRLILEYFAEKIFVS